MPPAAVGRLERRRRQPRLAAVAGLTLVALLPPLAHFHHAAIAARAAVDDYERLLAPVVSRQVHHESLLRRLDEMRQQVVGFENALRLKSTWLNFLAGLEERLGRTGNVWLERMEVVSEPVGAVRARHRLENESFPAEVGGPEPAAKPRLHLSGRMLDVEPSVGEAGPGAFERLSGLWENLVELPPVIAVEGERFDATGDGLIRFEVRLVLDPARPL